MGWRTVVVQKANQLSLTDGNLAVKKEAKELFLPTQQVQTLFIANSQGDISLNLINELSADNTSVIICDKKHRPSCQIIPFGIHNNLAGNIIDQAKWDKNVCENIWQEIIKQKIGMQILLLKQKEIPLCEKLTEYQANVLPGDVSNREGQAARMYFNRLFGSKFRRHSQDNINAALNYAYTIILSEFNRIVVSHGYHTALGINHRSHNNPFNLSCDLMEPFRPFADKIVFENKNRTLDWEYKKELIEIPNNFGRYNNKKYLIKDIMELFTLDVLKKLKKTSRKLGEISFYE